MERGVRASLFALCGAVIATFASHAIALMLVPLQAAESGASAAAIGAILAVSAFVSFASTMAVGVIVDQRDVRSLMHLGALGLALSCAIGWWNGTLLALALVHVGVSMANLLLVLASQSYVARTTSPVSREAAYGWMTMAVSGGQLVGPLVAGAVVERVGYASAFGAAALLPLMATPLVALLRPPEPSDARESAARPSLLPNGAGSILRIAPARAAIGISFGVAFGQAIFIGFFAVYLVSLGYSTVAVGALLSLRALTSMAVRPFTARVVRALRSRERTLFTMAATLALGFATIGVVNAPLALALLVIILGAAFGWAPPLSMAIVADHARDRALGLALSVRITANRLAQFLAPLGVGLVIQGSTYRGGFLATAAVVAIVAISFRGHRGAAKGSADR